MSNLSLEKNGLDGCRQITIICGNLTKRLRNYNLQNKTLKKKYQENSHVKCDEMFILNYNTGIYTVTQNETTATIVSFLGNVQIFAKSE